MTSEQIQNILIGFITEEFLYNRPEIALTNDLNIIDQGIVDSMDLFRLIEFLEDEAGVMWEPEEMVQKNFQTIKAITALVLRKLAE